MMCVKHPDVGKGRLQGVFPGGECEECKGLRVPMMWREFARAVQSI